jgi:hypothetical protein
MVTVTLVGYPIALANRTRRHYEAIEREFALIHFSDETTKASVPARLLEVAELTRAALASGQVVDRERIANGSELEDGTITVEVEAARWARSTFTELVGLLAEADEFCREGDLITQPMAPECREFREWILGELVRQIDGEAPRPWSPRAG